jgi:hypothetical protein
MQVGTLGRHTLRKECVIIYVELALVRSGDLLILCIFKRIFWREKSKPIFLVALSEYQSMDVFL